MSASKDADVEQSEKPKQGSHPKGKKPYKGKESKSIDFQPGAFKPLIPIEQASIAGQYHEFSHDQRGLGYLMDNAEPLVEEVNHSKFNSALQPNEISDSLHRMGHILVAKKLAYALDDDNVALYAAELKPIRQCTIFAPEPFTRIADGYGCFKLDGANYRPTGIAFHAFSHFIKATYVDGQNQINGPLTHNDLVVNTLFPEWRAFVNDHYSTIYKAWASRSDTVLITVVAGQNVSMKPPEVIGTYIALRAVFGALNIQPPERVERALIILSIMEAGVGGIGVGQMGVLIQNGLHLVAMAPQVQKTLCNGYIRMHQSRISGHLSTLYKCDSALYNMSAFGQPWQLVDSQSAERGVHPFLIGASFAEVGYMLDNRVTYKFNMQQVQTFSSTTRDGARATYLRQNRLQGD